MGKEDVVCVCVCIYIYIYAMEYYSSIKKNEMMSSAATWMDSESLCCTSETNTML